MKDCLFLKGLKEDDHPHGKYTAPSYYAIFSPRRAPHVDMHANTYLSFFPHN